MSRRFCETWEVPESERRSVVHVRYRRFKVVNLGFSESHLRAQETGQSLTASKNRAQIRKVQTAQLTIVAHTHVSVCRPFTFGSEAMPNTT